MMSWPKEGMPEFEAFYGDPDGDNNGDPDRAWEEANLVRVKARWRMVASWDTNLAITSIRVHWRCAESLSRVLDAIALRFSTQKAIEEARMHLFGGGYNFRLKRNGNSLSTHSYGCAVDFDPARNGLGKPWKANTGMMDLAVVEAFKAEGWVWGGDWSTADAMHFQAARTR